MLAITRVAEPEVEDADDGHAKRYWTKDAPADVVEICRKLLMRTETANVLPDPAATCINVVGKKLDITGGPEITTVNSKLNTAIFVGNCEL